MASSAPPPALTLPPSQFARLQPHAYLLAHLSPPASSNQPSLRANGRQPAQFRPTSANTGSLTHTNGSAVVRVGDTTAVCGVRAELLPTSDIASWSVSHASSGAHKRATTTKNDADADADESHIQDLNLLVPNLSLSTGCAPGFVPGAPPSALAQSLSHQILGLLHSTRLVRAEDLRVWYQVPSFGGDGDMDVDAEEDEGRKKKNDGKEIKAFWVLYIDIMIISLAGNAFDAAWAAVLAALRDTRLPRAWWDADNEMVVCSEAVAEATRLSLRGLPIASSFCVFEADAAAGWRAVIVPDAEEEKKIEEDQRRGMQRRWILADPDGYEEGLSQERVCLVVDREMGKTVIVKMEKNGGWAVDGRELKQLVDTAAERWESLKLILEQC
ncbi:3' exoribonuclease family protein [Aspergillus brunneoviolaceus CBS 621.78]|uniref:Exoribonuclease family protein n=1 Tax=Aspergillus brunneoviolaceus CBS 621.78 TaxID=1450534 RepID=A0ACD1G0D0_9EURO|nr:exoribonuclease family protein [Aspergillus brunneoviolaceus CBS 621.78]RAH42704.1 exoribonuclease family protein [Aspergillus brunneoviolaceus CBS 621.78]